MLAVILPLVIWAAPNIAVVVVTLVVAHRSAHGRDHAPGGVADGGESASRGGHR